MVVAVVVVSVVVGDVVGVVRLHFDAIVPSKKAATALFTCATVSAHAWFARKYPAHESAWCGWGRGGSDE